MQKKIGTIWERIQEQNFVLSSKETLASIMYFTTNISLEIIVQLYSSRVSILFQSNYMPIVIAHRASNDLTIEQLFISSTYSTLHKLPKKCTLQIDFPIVGTICTPFTGSFYQPPTQFPKQHPGLSTSFNILQTKSKKREIPRPKGYPVTFTLKSRQIPYQKLYRDKQ